MHKSLPSSTLERKEGTFAYLASDFATKTTLEWCIGIFVPKKSKGDQSINVLLIVVTAFHC
jgi:hypothetical protein